MCMDSYIIGIHSKSISNLLVLFPDSISQCTSKVALDYWIHLANIGSESACTIFSETANPIMRDSCGIGPPFKKADVGDFRFEEDRREYHIIF